MILSFPLKNKLNASNQKRVRLETERLLKDANTFITTKVVVMRMEILDSFQSSEGGKKDMIEMWGLTE